MAEWHDEEGWGVLTSPSLELPVWAHYSVVQAEGFRALSPGEDVRFEAEQDAFQWRATAVWPVGGTTTSPHSDGPEYTSSLDITPDP
ncbi:cold shock domain-containing protein [Streptomyces sp. NPDC005953]|uniref:cold-shock protein n=1 Tax=Streptomyces sp. NPDC005953 TaxID=3156719 RepID=UPI0033EE063F